jgi:transcriptional regulator GlxA family with amidase domain
VPSRASDLDEAGPVQRVGYLLIPGFSLLAYACAVEPLRAANQLSARTLYGWTHIVPTGDAAVASNGAQILADRRVGEAGPRPDLLIVCAGGDSLAFDHPPTFAWLRGLALHGVRLGGVSAGPYILAKAGLLAGHRCTIHWEHVPAFREAFPELSLTRTLYEIDRDRLTCSGATAALDMMHALIEADHGPRLAAAVSDWFLHSQVREGSGPQRMTLRERYQVSHPRLLRVLEEMERRIEEPASREALAAVAGVSVRQLERLFKAYLGTGIREHYLRVRLERAHLLLRQTTLPVLEIAVACGFVSASHFSRSYKAAFGQAPRGERRPPALSRPGQERSAAGKSA